SWWAGRRRASLPFPLSLGAGPPDDHYGAARHWAATRGFQGDLHGLWRSGEFSAFGDQVSIALVIGLHSTEGDPRPLMQHPALVDLTRGRRREVGEAQHGNFRSYPATV